MFSAPRKTHYHHPIPCPPCSAFHPISLSHHIPASRSPSWGRDVALASGRKTAVLHLAATRQTPPARTWASAPGGCCLPELDWIHTTGWQSSYWSLESWPSRPPDVLTLVKGLFRESLRGIFHIVRGQEVAPFYIASRTPALPSLSVFFLHGQSGGTTSPQRFLDLHQARCDGTPASLYHRYTCIKLSFVTISTTYLCLSIAGYTFLASSISSCHSSHISRS
ncbi:hypothetical protein B0T14DRAFT_183395 [Immersiella caudata]|uniref:Uncharacterized protein n=1 Tax=Immersiella caudata TaxID=314043 RepID=A0AA39WXT2_9PEZI|nr:hypothetical protein B0T14DRAFT_183395 [Immersiella caudata]